MISCPLCNNEIKINHHQMISKTICEIRGTGIGCYCRKKRYFHSNNENKFKEFLKPLEEINSKKIKKEEEEKRKKIENDLKKEETLKNEINELITEISENFPTDIKNNTALSLSEQKKYLEEIHLELIKKSSLINKIIDLQSKISPIRAIEDHTNKKSHRNIKEKLWKFEHSLLKLLHDFYEIKFGIMYIHVKSIPKGIQTSFRNEIRKIEIDDEFFNKEKLSEKMIIEKKENINNIFEKHNLKKENTLTFFDKSPDYLALGSDVDSVRFLVVKELIEDNLTKEKLLKNVNRDEELIEFIISDLMEEGLLKLGKDNKFRAELKLTEIYRDLDDKRKEKQNEENRKIDEWRESNRHVGRIF